MFILVELLQLLLHRLVYRVNVQAMLSDEWANSLLILCTPRKLLKVTRKELNYLVSQALGHFFPNMDFLVWMIWVDDYLLELFLL